MRVEPLDAAPSAGVDAPLAPVPQRVEDGNAFGALVAAARATLDEADAAEGAFARGHGDLQAMVFARARADISVAIAAAGAQRASQALSTLLGMQV